MAESLQVEPPESGEDEQAKHPSFQTRRTPRSAKWNSPARIRRLESITEIRRRVSRGDSNRQVMTDLRLPERTFYRYMRQAFIADAEALKEQDRGSLALELETLRARLLAAYRRLLKTCEHSSIPIAERLKAEVVAAEVAVLIARLTIESPLIMKDFAGLQELTR